MADQPAGGDEEPAGGRRRVVIVGGGFGGLAAAQHLRRAEVDVTVVDRTNHHLFQPLLYQHAMGGISEGDLASPIRGHLRKQANATTLMAEVADIDVNRCQLTLDRGERLDYDSLIVACGGETSYFGNDEWKQASFGLKTLEDSTRLRNQVFAALEEAERATDDEQRSRWLTFVVVGGGPTGVELAGALAVLTRHAIERDYSRIDSASARVILVDAGDRVVPSFKPGLSAKVAGYLDSMGVSVHERAKATAIDAEGVTIEVGGETERIDAKTVIWAAGVQAAGFAGVLAGATGVEPDRRGGIPVRPDLSIEGYPEISVIGDVSSVAGPDGKPLPGLATTAIQQGRHVAKGIRDGRAGASTPFKYLDKGALAVVGRGKAVCEVRGRGLAGLAAFAMYLGVHLYYLGGVRGRRISVLSAWLSARSGQLHDRVIETKLPTS